ncbi:MAG: twin-arginine translocation signal domain-containing protein, partial [Gammaproteobacteria bacterium]|nr:twin-arginine translocation signal domain-containing protein [Gammaproteobacteria bacterium]
MVTRRNFLKSSAAMSALAALPLSLRWSIAQATGLITGLSDPALQPMFMNLVPDAMAPGFKYVPDRKGN